MAANASATGQKSTILVIDDEEVVRLLFQNLLEDEGYATLLAADGHQGISLLDSAHPPLVLVDKNLPDISGLELISTQKKRHPNTEFIMITGYASLDSAVKAMEVGAFSYLTKPFVDMEVVLDRIRAALEVNNLRTETSLLRDRLNRLSQQQPQPVAASRAATTPPTNIVNQLQHTLSLIESFHLKRDQVPTPSIWARLVDMLEAECLRLRKVLREEGRFPG